MSYNLITVLGPTAVGKTKLAAYLAYQFNGEIISADSRQVYKHMDIGTGKDFDDYYINGTKVNFHLIDIVEPSEEYNLYRFYRDFKNAYKKITAKGKLPFLAGGTGLYLSAVIQNYKLPKADFAEERLKELNQLSIDKLRTLLIELKPKLHNVTDLKDKERIIKAIIIEEAAKSSTPEDSLIINSLNIGIKLERDEIKRRITERLKKRLKSGMIEEVEKLVEMGITHEKLRFFGLEYKYISLYLRGELNYNDMYQKLNSAIHNFAKRQMTWFRKMEREGVEINWFSGKNYEEIKNFITKRLKRNEQPTR